MSSEKHYRGYILCRLSRIGSEWDIVERLKKTHYTKDSNLNVTYASPIYGAWDLIIEASFARLEDLDSLVTFIRTDPELQKNVEETTTLVSSRPDYPWS
ncbi:MAG: hypothetical protein ACTSRA_01490 [Promethearchaeota archaeon]